MAHTQHTFEIMVLKERCGNSDIYWNGYWLEVTVRDDSCKRVFELVDTFKRENRHEAFPFIQWFLRKKSQDYLGIPYDGSHLKARCLQEFLKVAVHDFPLGEDEFAFEAEISTLDIEPDERAEGRRTWTGNTSRRSTFAK